MSLRRMLAPAVWLMATVTAATLVTGAVRLALRSVSPPALATRPSGGHQRGAGSGTASAGASGLTPPAGVDLGAGGGGRLPVVDGSPEAARAGAGGQSASGGASRQAAPGTARAASGTPAGSTTDAPAAPADQSGTATSAAPADPGTGTQAPTSSSTTSTTTARGASPSSTTSTTSSSTTTSPPEQSYVYKLDGGTVGVRCKGDTVSLTFASPNDGWNTDVISRGPDLVNVRFTRGRDVSQLRVTCTSGQADPHIDEQQG